MAKRKLKVRSDTGKVFMSKVVTDGKAQTQFKAKAVQVGACVRSKTEGKSYNRDEQIVILREYPFQVFHAILGRYLTFINQGH